MAIATEFIDFIVPIQTIRDKYPGGWEGCLQDYAGLIDGCVWFDQYLFRIGAMNPIDIESLIQEWTTMGLECMGEKDGKKYWKEVCVFEEMLGGPTLECDWLSVDKATRAVYLKGTAMGEIIYPNRYYEEWGE
jgi:hypothetical protein